MQPQGAMFLALLATLVAASAACGDPLSFQVLLDRQGFSPGEIDGQLQTNGSHALAAFQQARGLEETGRPDCDTWRALTAGHPDPPIALYKIKPEDVRGPFTRTIPDDLEQQAKLPALGYRSVLEDLAERFHAAPALLQRLNRRSRFTAGSTIKVPHVTPFDASAKPVRADTKPVRQNTKPGGVERRADITVEVSKDTSSLRIIGNDGKTMFFAPVTSGSDHDPLPLGEWHVTTIEWAPPFHYNPELFWDADPADSRATLAPGPNSPVGVVWIGINVEHYGLHGTPEPSMIGHAESHGCVRLTNWDAARVARTVAVGTPVIFK